MPELHQQHSVRRAERLQHRHRPVRRAATAAAGFNCNNAGCVGDNAGLVCDTATGQCVNCTSLEQCRAGFGFCNSNGRCVGQVACDENADCENILSTANPDLEPLVCNEDGNESSEFTEDVCVFDPSDYVFTSCNADNDCQLGGAFPEFCVLGACLADCRSEGQEDCDEYWGPNVAVCVNGVCIKRD